MANSLGVAERSLGAPQIKQFQTQDGFPLFFFNIPKVHVVTCCTSFDHSMRGVASAEMLAGICMHLYIV